MIITLLFFIYVMFMTAFRPTVMYNAVFNFMTEIEVILFLLYWIPTWIYLISIVVFFSWVNKITVVVSIVIGAIQVVYHVLIAIIWAATWTDEYKHYPLQNCFLYWITILFSLILIALTIFLRIRIDFLIKPQEDIEKMEVEEMRREQMETEDDRIKKLMQK